MLLVAACASELRPDPAHGQSPHHPRTQAATKQTTTDPGATPALDVRATSSLEGITPELAGTRVVLVGETHDRYDHHLNQLEIIRRLHEREVDFAVGLEFFHRPFQQYLDQYIAGDLSELAMLEKTEYYQRWAFDYRMYAPILRYAKAHGIPLVALNLPHEITRQVGREGIDSLDPEQSAQIPADMDRSVPGYRERLKAIFEQHPMGPERDFENFVDVQLLWDEGMAESAAAYLEANPGRSLVVLAGSGHVDRRYGIPARIERRLDVETAVVVNQDDIGFEPGMGDFLLFPQQLRLPPTGKLGIMLETVEDGVFAQKVFGDSAAEAAGIRKRDRLVSIAGRPIADITDLRLAMWDKAPGETVSVEVRRKRWLSAEKTLRFDITLK